MKIVKYETWFVAREQNQNGDSVEAVVKHVKEQYQRKIVDMNVTPEHIIMIVEIPVEK